MALFNPQKVKQEKQAKLAEDPIIAKINQRRRQLLVHSCIYYRMNDNLIEDYLFDQFAHELKDLVIKYPEKAKLAVYAKEFKGWDSEPHLFSGYCLPYDDDWVIHKALQLLHYRDQKRIQGLE
jgi:hypothetical protein